MGPGRLFVADLEGVIHVVLPGEGRREVPFLDLRDRVDREGEGGLLGLAFHPGFADNGRFFVNYTRLEDNQFPERRLGVRGRARRPGRRLSLRADPAGHRSADDDTQRRRSGLRTDGRQSLHRYG